MYCPPALVYRTLYHVCNCSLNDTAFTKKNEVIVPPSRTTPYKSKKNKVKINNRVDINIQVVTTFQSTYALPFLKVHEVISTTKLKNKLTT